jgi:hypothetical protein
LLRLDDVVWFGKTKPPKEDSDAWFDYRDTVFGPKVVQLLKQLYPSDMTASAENDNEQCDYTDPDVWNFPTWQLTKKGLYLGAIFARAERVCDNPGWSVIPYKALKPYLNPASRLKLPD